MDALEDIDSRVALRLGKEEVLSVITRENPGIDDLIAKIAIDQFPRVKSRYNAAIKPGCGMEQLLEFREQFYNIISAEVREAVRHDKARRQYNKTLAVCPLSPKRLLHSDPVYEEALSYYQYHGYTTGFDGNVLLSETD